MKCQRVLDMLTAYIDQQLSDEQRALVSSHLETCEQCQEIFRRMQMVTSFLNEVEEVEPPADLKLNVMSEIMALNDEKAVMTPLKGIKQKKHFWRVKRLAAAFAIFFLSIGYGLQPVYMQAFDKSDAMESVELADDAMIVRSIAPTEKGTAIAAVPEEPLMMAQPESAEPVRAQVDNGKKMPVKEDEEVPELMLLQTAEEGETLQKQASNELNSNITVTSNEMVAFTAEDKSYGTMEGKTASKSTERRLIISGSGILLSALLFYMSRIKR